jgi:hypothetical protein
VIAAALSALCVTPSLATGGEEEESPDLFAWRDTIARTPPPAGGCAEVDYPATAWTAVPCVEAPLLPHMPHAGPAVGDGTDYVAYKAGDHLYNSEGSFPSVTGVQSETDNGAPNLYSLQLNTNGSYENQCFGLYGSCLQWVQYFYSSESGTVGMRSWMGQYPWECPFNIISKVVWHRYGTDECYLDSVVVRVPQIAITHLHALRLSATINPGSLVTLTFMDGAHAYSTTAGGFFEPGNWNASEFNVYGAFFNSQAVFNTGSDITVQLVVQGANHAAPVCSGGIGGTYEGANNLTLGTCSGTRGSKPHITFTESN